MRRNHLLLAPFWSVAPKILAIIIVAHLFLSTHAISSPQYQQHNNILHFVVPEGAPNNTYLGNIRSADNQPPYLVLPAPQTPEVERVAALSINLQNGDLTTNAVLDREHREQYHFVAIVKEPFAEIKCTVTVKDVNDNAPIFLTQVNETSFVVDVPENSKGVRKVLPLAVDFDTPQFGIKEFRIVSGNTPSGTFQLVEHEAPARSTLIGANMPLIDDSSSSIVAGDNPQLMQQLAQQATVLIPSQPAMQSAVSGGSAPSILTSSTVLGGQAASVNSQSKFLIDLEVNQILDRENQSSYQLVVEAIDGGQPPLLGRLMVTVNVQDANDNDPIFTRKSYECHVKEDSPKGTFLIRVQATDADLDSNGQISYFIKRHSSPSQPNSVINSNSSDNIESSSASRYSTATNNKQRQQQQATVTQPPTNVGQSKIVSAAQVKPLGNNEIYESQANGAVDLSVPKTKLAYGAPEQLFEIDQTKGDIILAHQLDYETDQTHELLIEARDHGKPARSGFVIVKVFVIDVYDDPPPTQPINRHQEPKENTGSSVTQTAKSTGEPPVDKIYPDGLPNYLPNWFLFSIVLCGLFIIACSVCLVRTKSRQPESDYNDTAGLTLTSNNGYIKQSPNHSTSNEHTNGSSDSHHRHHDHQRRSNGSFGGLNGIGFGTPNGKMRYQYDSSNLYHNPYTASQQSTHRHTSNQLRLPNSPSNRQMAAGCGSASGTMALHSHHHHHHHAVLGSSGGHHHSLEHHHQFAGANGPPAHHSSSLTYAHHHSRAALLQQAHHHQSSHHLSSVHQQGHNMSKGGTMNSIGTHHSAHPSASPLPATPNTTHSSGLPPNLHDVPHHANGHHGGHTTSLLPLMPSLHHSASGQHQAQLPSTPCNGAPASMFAWPQGVGSTIGGFMGSGSGPMHGSGGDGGTSGSPIECAPNSQPLDRWFDLGVSSQLVYPHDWCGSYDWDYLTDWTPDYHNLMQLIQADA